MKKYNTFLKKIASTKTLYISFSGGTDMPYFIKNIQVLR